MHGHWVIPAALTALAAAPGRPLVVSLHGSDVYVAETLAPARLRRAARSSRAPGAITACSADLARRARSRSAPTRRSSRSCPTASTRRASGRDRERARGAARALGVADGAPLVFAAGRLVRKKGFEYLIDAVARRRRASRAAILAIAGDGDLETSCATRARAAGVAERVRFLGNLVAGRRRAATSPPPTSSSSRRSRRRRQRRRPAERRARGAGLRHAARRDAGGRHRRGRRARADRAARARARRRGLAAAIARAGRRSRRCGRALGAGARRRWWRRVSAGHASPSASRRPTAARLPCKSLRTIRLHVSPMPSACTRGSLASASSFPPTTTAGPSPAW